MRTEYIKEFPVEEICVQNITLISTQDANGIVGNQTKYMRAQNTFEHVSFPISNIKNTEKHNFEISKKFQIRKVGTLPGPINLLVVTNKHLPRSFKVTASCLIVGEGGRGRH